MKTEREIEINEKKIKVRNVPENISNEELRKQCITSMMKRMYGIPQKEKFGLIE